MAIAVYSNNELNSILEQFTVPKADYIFQSMTSGLINDTFLVSVSGNPLYVLQRINHKVFENVEGLMVNIGRAVKHLKGNQYEKVVLIATTSGKNYSSTTSGYWRMMTYVANSTTYNNASSPKIAFEAGRIIAAFHSLLGTTEIDKYTDTIYKFHNLAFRKMQFLAVLSKASNEKKAIAKEAISFAEDTLTKLEALVDEQLPKRICHNDTKLNNILFSRETNTALCLIDLDTIMPGYFLYDFGDAVRTIANRAAEDEQDHSKITFEKALFEAFIKGLGSNGPFLSEKEIQSLVTGAVLMPFLHGLRALTDYLNNNKYYKVTYENQNLDRAASLFAFTQKALDNTDYMSQTVLSVLRPNSPF